MSILNQIFDRHLTDKGTTFDAKHGYGTYYDKYLSEYRNKEIKLLEVGIYKGNSIKAWREYFSKAYIYGIDSGMVVPVDTSLNNLDRVRVDTIDVFKPEFSSYIAHHGPFDIIIDDCSHKLDNQQVIFETTYDYLTDKGVYVIEDVNHVQKHNLRPIEEMLSKRGIVPQVYDSNFNGTKIVFFSK